jgi:hypothetical protein
MFLGGAVIEAGWFGCPWAGDGVVRFDAVSAKLLRLKSV